MASNPWLIPSVLVVAVVAVGAAFGGWIVLVRDHPSAGNPYPTIVQGGNVTVNYIGLFGSGPEQGKVFDTSIYGVSVDNAQFPKSLEYHARGPAKNYTTLDVHVGPAAPSGGYTLGNLTFIQVVPGFWQGIIGMHPNSTRTIVVPPELGYGSTNTACVATLPLVDTLPVLQTYPGQIFQSSFPGITSYTAGEEFTDPHFGWTDQILSANSSYVTVQRLPYVGFTSSLSGWPVSVTSVTSTPNGSGQITVRNELAPSQAGHLLGKDFLGTGPCSSTSGGQFIVTGVDLGAGTYTENFNQEVQGQTLIFIVTVVDYFASSGSN